MYLVTRNLPLKHWSAQTSLPTTGLIGGFVHIKKIPSEFQTGWICRARSGPALSADKKNDREDAPTHPLMEMPGIAHEQHTRIKSGGSDPLTIAVFLFNDPPTVKVI